MNKRNLPRKSSAARKLAELGFAAPQVVAHRLTRMALAGPVLTPRDQREFTAMVREKQLAFSQGWLAASVELVKVHQALAWSVSSSLWSFKSPLSQSRSAAAQVQAAMSSVGNKFIEPVHRKAMANARRLAKTPLR